MSDAIQAVFFDYDGVLGEDEHSFLTTCAYIARTEKLDFEMVLGAYTRYAPALRTGKVTEKQVWPAFCKEIGKDIDFSVLEAAFAASTINKETLAIAKKLKKSGTKVGIITDNTTARIAVLKKKHDLGKTFSPIINGAKYSTSKTHPQSAVTMFEAALAATKIKAQNAIFIDNMEENLSIPEAMGFHVYHHDCELNDVLALKIYLSGFGLIV